MAKVLISSSTVSCPAQGKVTPTGRPRLTVDGVPVVRLDGISGKTVSGCTTPTDPNTSSVQCQTVASVGNAAGKLTVDGAGVALDTSTGSTNGSQPTLSFTAGQNKLTAV
ncbi:hypothetical protein [Micromonospora siamensis]|uniref:PAAR motif-containing protein n=1 Tax=Micromonospora siamensis TaxID=299152 RepID=A0A1C5J1T4_9ACTN|nr:hypothetical protein [Micromonospora siamensis]SCG64485.1 hypothetical protein GA0074704_4029 [Micromonospora siamensis]